VPTGRTFGYVRVSTDEQVAGESLAVQQQQLSGWAQMHGRVLTAVAVEKGISGSIPFIGRPEGRKLWEQLHPGDTLVGAKLDRLFRSAVDCLHVVEELKARGVSLYLLDLNGGADDVSGNGVARLFLSLLSAFAEFERDRIQERIRAAKQRRKAEGYHGGGTREFGYRIGQDLKLIEDPDEQAAIRRMEKLHNRGWSLRKIQAEMADAGYVLNHNTVARLLRRTSRPVRTRAGAGSRTT
jgi:DNA invertase Pin-like site-specific DNA recombinase